MYHNVCLISEADAIPLHHLVSCKPASDVKSEWEVARWLGERGRDREGGRRRERMREGGGRK